MADRRRRNLAWRLAITGLASLALGATARAQSAAPPPSASADNGDQSATPQRFAVHGQVTVVEQALAGFSSPYRGENSLDPGTRGRETVTATLYAGFSPWKGAQIWVDPAVDQGLSLSDSRGVAGYLNGEAPRGGVSDPYFHIQRAFLTQTISLGGAVEAVDADANALRGSQSANRIVLTVGKVAVGDIFDLNDVAHDSQEDFLNGSVLSAGAFDFATNRNGDTYGVAGEIYAGPWSLRLGAFDLTATQEGAALDGSFGQFQMVVEGERRYRIFGQDGSVKITAFDSRGRMGDYAAAVALGLASGETPDVTLVSRYRNRAGIDLNLQQQITEDLGVFARVSFADGHVQSFDFADIDRSVSFGGVLSGDRWGREDDAVGLALAVNDISSSFIRYLNAGGMGLVIGDGALPHPGSENIVEAFYKWSFADDVHVTFDYQFVDHPAYNRDRGPVSVFALRLHAAF